MKLTKYEHACFAVEKDGKLLVVDPGVFTTDLESPENVSAIVVTHEHPDHFDPAALGALIAHNPDAIILAHENITRQLGDTLPNRAVTAGESHNIGPFTVEFFGGEHAIIHSSISPIANLGVMINDSIYYPGDSFTLPQRPVAVLALPVSAPWMKISEAMDYIGDVKATLVLPTHDAILSQAGKDVVDRMLSSYMEKYSGTYRRLTEIIEI